MAEELKTGQKERLFTIGFNIEVSPEYLLVGYEFKIEDDVLVFSYKYAKADKFERKE